VVWDSEVYCNPIQTPVAYYNSYPYTNTTTHTKTTYIPLSKYFSLYSMTGTRSVDFPSFQLADPHFERLMWMIRQLRGQLRKMDGKEERKAFLEQKRCLKEFGIEFLIFRLLKEGLHRVFNRVPLIAMAEPMVLCTSKCQRTYASLFTSTAGRPSNSISTLTTFACCITCRESIIRKTLTRSAEDLNCARRSKPPCLIAIQRPKHPKSVLDDQSQTRRRKHPITKGQEATEIPCRDVQGQSSADSEFDLLRRWDRTSEYRQPHHERRPDALDGYGHSRPIGLRQRDCRRGIW